MLLLVYHALSVCIFQVRRMFNYIIVGCRIEYINTINYSRMPHSSTPLSKKGKATLTESNRNKTAKLSGHKAIRKFNMHRVK